MKKFCLFFTLLLLAGVVGAQDKPAGTLLRHEMTPEEVLRKGEIGKNFVETDPPVGPVRNVAEADRMQGALVRYPFGIPILLIKEMAEDVMVTTIVATQSQKTSVINQYLANGVDTSHCNFLIAPSDSYWTRDYGPWFESDSSNQVGIIDFPYNRPRPNDDEIAKRVADMLGIPWFGMNIDHTGGNYMTDGYGIGSSTNLVWVENPSQSHAQIAAKMNSYLGITNYQVVPDANISTTIDHIDCWSKFLAPDKILIRKVLTSDPEYNSLESAATYWASQVTPFGYNYKVYRVMTPQDQPYTNSVILNNKVLVPIMNSTWDDTAIAAYQAAMPGYEIIGFLGNPSTPWLSTDALHCRVMGIADLGILFIKHLPVYGVQPCESNYTINADIIACSDSAVKSDSVLIWYKVNNGSFQAVPMINTSANHYTGIIPMQPAGSTVKYYLFAADKSNRRATAPFIGAADPYTFTTAYTNVAAIPDTLWFLTFDDIISGKVTYLHNYMASGTNLTGVQQISTGGLPWYVDSMSVNTFPHMMNPGDSVYVRVKVNITTLMAPSMQFAVDTLHYTTALGTGHVIIMINDELLTGTGKINGTKLLGNSYPNPFTTQTFIPFMLTEPGIVYLDVVDIRGNRVKTLCAGMFPQGSHTVLWDGTGDNGSKVSSGVYFYQLTTEKERVVKRTVLIR